MNTRRFGPPGRGDSRPVLDSGGDGVAVGDIFACNDTARTFIAVDTVCLTRVPPS